MRQTLALSAATLLVAASAGAAAAFDYNSAYTDIDLDNCTVMLADDMGVSYACPGYKGWPLYVAEGDLRFMVSYGFGADEEKAAKQTPPPFNYLGPKIEWRLSNTDGNWKPFATIVRYYLDNDGPGNPAKQILAVTRIEPGKTCQIAYIDALENQDANDMARQFADEKAAGFDCGNDPEIVGTFKAW